jgi:eukaryotic-like serine/threonine-protein kinase
MNTPATSGEKATASVDRVGQLISGRYRICSLLGEGGMGAVYLAEHTHMKKRFAMKLLHPEMADREEVLARFRREAEAAAHVEHPNIVAATDFGQTDDGAFFLVLEYVDGISLRAKLATGALGTVRALHIARQIALALERAHDSGIIHRDLKPENVMLVTKGEDSDFVKVLDFGVARFDPPSGEGGQPLTQLGTVMGTPAYMAPEQAVGERVSNRADLYALGCLMYEMLTGELPFEGEMMTLLTKHIMEPVPPMAERAPAVTVPEPVEAVVRKLLEKDPNSRYQNARALVEAIDKAAVESGLDMPSLTPISDRLSAAALPPSAVVISTGTPREVVLAKTAIAGQAASRPDRAAQLLERLRPLREKVSVALKPATTRIVAFLDLLEERLKLPKRLIVAAVGGLVALSFLVTVIAVRRAPRRPDDNVVVKVLSVGQTAGADKIRAAATKGPAALEELAAEFPSDPAVLRELSFAYDAAGRTSDVLRVVRLMTEADAKGVPRELVRLVMRAASKFETSDEAFRLLEGPLGANGVDALIELAEGRDVPVSTSTRAQKSLAKPGVRSNASPASALILDLANASSCDERHDVLVRSGSQADGRALPLLRALESKRGCGRGRRRGCHPCLRDDDALSNAIEAAELHTSN